MSLPKRKKVRCTKCGGYFDVTVFDSINTDYAPDVPERIKSLELFQAKCPHCGKENLLVYNMLYHDLKHNAMIWLLFPYAPDYEKQMRALRKQSLRPGYIVAPNQITRIVSNFHELREKVCCLEKGRDDRVITLCKMLLMGKAQKRFPDRTFFHALYSYDHGEEVVQFIEKDGQDTSCTLSEAYYNEIAQAFAEPLARMPDAQQSPFPIIDMLWADEFFERHFGGNTENT